MVMYTRLVSLISISTQVRASCMHALPAEAGVEFFEKNTFLLGRFCQSRSLMSPNAGKV